MASSTVRTGDTLHRWLLIVAYTALIVAPMVAVGLAREPTGHSFLYTIGKNFALAGFTIVALQFVLSARFQWVERPFGQDLLYDFHRAMAVVATILIVLHPLLMAVGDGAWELLYDPAIGWEIWLGRIALVLVLLHVIGSSLRKALGVEYELWKLGHNISALTILGLAFVHSYARGGDFDQPFLALLWPALFLFAAGTWITSSVIRPWLLRRRPWRVVSVDRETHDTWTVAMEPPEGEDPYEHAPGQFHFIVFRRGRDLPVERHHWTISSSPEEPRIRASTIKESGDFTATIGETRPGDEALVYGPFGRFSHALHPEEGDLVFVSGGIGITPMMSMLRYMHDTGDERQVRLVYTNQEERDIVFRKEIDRIAARGALQLEVTHMLEEPPEDWTGESGVLDAGSMERLLGPFTESRTFYVCGPPPMMDAVIDWLTDRGVPRDRIHSERFEL
jgi:predicted ferric reductase